MKPRVAVLGLGAMGQRMALRLLDAGCQVVVWNRNPAKAGPLVEAGAVRAGTPAEAAVSAVAVISMVRDDGASRQVWTAPGHGALGALSSDAVAIECSTLTLGWVRQLAVMMEARGVGFLDAPVVGSRPQAQAGQLVHLVGGDPAVLARVGPLLQAWSASIHHAGPTGGGTLLKLMLNQLFAIQVAAMAELVGTVSRLAADPTRAVEIITGTAVCSPALKVAAASMLAGNFAPQFPIELVAKDLLYAGNAAMLAGLCSPMGDAVRRVYADAIAAELGPENITAVARLYR